MVRLAKTTVNHTKKYMNKRAVRKPYSEIRAREYLTSEEMDKLLDAAKKSGKLSKRNYAMILIAYRHGLRCSELCNLKWEAIDLAKGTIYVNRLKGSDSGLHPLGRDEIRALNQLKAISPDSPFVFLTRSGVPISEILFYKSVQRLGVKAGLPFAIHPHMLRHSCGYYLAQKEDLRVIQAYLGHRKIQSTVGYTALAPGRFKGLWD